MSKPDEIPQDIWDAARVAVGSPDVYIYRRVHTRVQIAVARALLAERERCAKVIDDECARILSKQDGTDHSVDANIRLVAVMLPEVSATIRKGAA